MSQSSELSRRERQIMDSLYVREGATVAQVRDDLRRRRTRQINRGKRDGGGQAGDAIEPSDSPVHERNRHPMLD